MERGQQFPICSECGEVGNHIHLTRDDVNEMQAISNASRMQGQMDEHMRTAPVELNDAHGLRAHLESSGHWETPHDGMSLEDLQALHDESHAASDSGPADEREPHTTLGTSHFHH
jgi:hypothetical protein